MIITRLKGGLGNQMFQYAAGYALSLEKKTSLKVDGSFLYESVNDSIITRRNFELDCFGIKDESRSASWIYALRRILLSRPYRVLNRTIPVLPFQYFQEKKFSYDPAFFQLKGNVFLDGYWQSELYFKKYRTQILKQFEISEPVSPQTLQLANYLSKNLTVSVHIRRGDLVTNPGAAAFHGTCDDAYYREALNNLRHEFPSIKVIAFSDEPDYVKNHMQFLQPEVIVDWNANKGYEDLYLMQRCSHHIIANSSFSWWGAWLNPAPSSRVIAPRQWFLHEETDTSTLIPERWQRI